MKKTIEEDWKETIKSRFYYKDGEIYLKERVNKTYFNINHANKPVGYSSQGYKRCSQDASGLGKRSFMVHRIVWLLNTGEWPVNNIDHINRDSLDNRFENLRDVTQAENNTNKGDYKAGGKFKGVYKTGDNWRVQISHKTKKYSLGHFKCLGEAVRAYDIACIKLKGKFARPNLPKETYRGVEELKDYF